MAASDVAEKARKLIRDLQDAVTKLEAAESIKDASLAVSWLRSDTWPAMQRSMDRIGTLREALDAARDALRRDPARDQRQGADARFRKTERGKFEYNG